MNSHVSPEALKGIRVCDFSWSLAGPLITKYLADYGATVVKVETAKHPCFIRTSAPFKDKKPGLDRSGYFAFFNANKYSISLDLENLRGIDVVKQLVNWSDIVCENFTPGVMKQLGLNYESVKQMKPGIIMISSSGQGQNGPYAQTPIGGNWLVSLSGFTSVTGWPDRAPTQPYGAYNDIISPRYGLVAVLAALRHRRLTGKGQYIDMSQLEAGMQFLGPLFLDFTVNGRQGKRNGNSCQFAAPHGVYPCREGEWCTIAVFTDHEWHAFCKALGEPSWALQPMFSTLCGRKQHEQELDERIAEQTIHFTKRELVSLLENAGVVAGPIHNAKDLFEDQQLAFRKAFWTAEDDKLGKYGYLGQAAILSKTPARCYRQSPSLGEHTEYVCKELLQMSDEAFVGLLNEGAFGI